MFLRALMVYRSSLSRAQGHPTVILSERVGAWVGAKDLRTNPDAEPRAARRSFAPLGPTHPSLQDDSNLDLSGALGRFFAQVGVGSNLQLADAGPHPGGPEYETIPRAAVDLRCKLEKS